MRPPFALRHTGENRVLRKRYRSALLRRERYHLGFRCTHNDILTWRSTPEVVSSLSLQTKVYSRLLRVWLPPTEKRKPVEKAYVTGGARPAASSPTVIATAGRSAVASTPPTQARLFR